MSERNRNMLSQIVSELNRKDRDGYTGRINITIDTHQGVFMQTDIYESKGKTFRKKVK